MSNEHDSWDEVGFEAADPQPNEKRQDDRVIEGVDLHLEDGLEGALDSQERGGFES